MPITNQIERHGEKAREKNTTSADGRKTISLQSIEYIRIDCSHDERMRYVNHGKQRDNFNL